MDVEYLLRLKGTLEGSRDTPAQTGGQGLVGSYARVRSEVLDAVATEHRAEFDRLFPVELETTGRPWGTQAEEVKLRFGQMAGWLDGMINGALLDRRIRAEAEAKAKKVGFA